MGLPDLEIQKGGWQKVIDTVRKARNDPEIAEAVCLFVYYDIPLNVVADLETRYLWNIYSACEGKFTELVALIGKSPIPAVWVDVFAVIEDEIHKIQKIKQKALEQKVTNGTSRRTCSTNCNRR